MNLTHQSSKRIQIVEQNSKCKIEHHEVGGFRFVFEDYVNSLGNKGSAEQALSELNLEYEIFSEGATYSVVKILSGPYAGYYDPTYNFESKTFSLIQDK
ncbi:hypothetical protein [Vibrio coralliilyticus]|uniref:hypothetical protein n=1 Tax=Vibrio coralliilyticus TaxID=190893 RepID=UPI000C170EEF|nr:hypothetical protein [Vibrio coralliilyticus]